MISCFNVTSEDRDVIQQSNYKMNRWKGRKSREEENVEPAPEFAKPLLKKINIAVPDVGNRVNRKCTQSESKLSRPKITSKSLSPMSNPKLEVDEVNELDLPDGSCFNRSMLLRFSTKLSTKECQYLGSFLVEGTDQESKSIFVRDQLQRLKNSASEKLGVVIVVSETGIKVCRPRSKSVLMAHALRRVSFATCDPAQRHFSFLAREPKGNATLQYCHAFLTDTAQQAEELSRLVGDSFRMAFAQQLQQQARPTATSAATSPIATSAAFLDLLCEIQSNRLDNSANRNGLGGSNCAGSVPQTSFVNCPDSPGPSVGLRGLAKLSTPAALSSPVRCKEPVSSPRRAPKPSREMNGNGTSLAVPRLPGQSSSPFHERIWAKSVAGSAKHHDPLVERGACAVQSSIQQQRGSPLTPRRQPPPASFPSSPSNCPSTSSARGADVGAYSVSSELWSPGSAGSCEDNTGLTLGSPTEFNSCSQFRDKPPLVKTLESSWTTTVNRTEEGGEQMRPETTATPTTETIKRVESVVVLPPTPTMTSKASFQQQQQSQSDDSGSVTSSASSELSSGANRAASRTSNSENNTSSLAVSEDSRSECSAGSTKRRGTGSGGSGSARSPPPIPERPNFDHYDRHDSLSSREEAEERELRGAPWFQAGIPREIALEILAQEPVGSFMVRESTSKPGCFALSLRVPRDFQPTGIAHYLIMRTHKGFKIKGFMKEFCSLTALITHHSVMPELLPCPLSLSRYNPVFRKQDASQDLVDIEDPDYNLLADFRKIMSSDVKA